MVGSTEGPAKAFKSVMRTVNRKPSIGRFNANGSKETTRTLESHVIIGSFVWIRASRYVIVDRVFKGAAHVRNRSRIASIFLLNTTNSVDTKRFLRNCLDAMRGEFILKESVEGRFYCGIFGSSITSKVR